MDNCLRVGLLAILLAGLYSVSTANENDNYPGVIELVGYSNRRARTYYAPNEDKPVAAPPAAKMQADIETVKQNIEKYNKLLTLDTKNLPESQKDMLERIVERVARLKESLDISDHIKTNASKTQKPKTPNSDNEENKEDLEEGEENSTLTPTVMSTNYDETEEENKTEPTLVLDETTLLQLQTSMDKLAAAQAAVTSQATQMREFPTTTEMIPEDNLQDEEDLQQTTENPDSEEEEEYDMTTLEPATDTTDLAEQFVAARSNNNVAGITAASDEAETMATLSTTIGSQRTLTTSAKLTKTRATKRPHHPANKNSNNSKRRPSTSINYNKNHNVKQKITNNNSGVTQPSLQQYQKLAQKPLQQQYVQVPQPSLQQGYQSQPPKAVSPSSISLDKYNSGSSSSIAPANVAASYGINSPSPLVNSAPATISLPANTYGSSASPSSLSSSAAAATSTSASQDLVYDSHVNASAIIDSLNNNAREEYYQQKQSLATGVATKDKKPLTGAKPTKYHYYPHNQHIYLLPECAIQQVCNAVYVRLNYTQPLCACPSRYRDPCSASLNEDDQHTTKLVGDGKKKAITLAKTCEATTEMRECRSPKDWSLLALQNTRTGKSHYLVICRCPDHFKMEGPMAHDQPTYASVPGIRVFGMMCVKPGYSVRKPSAQPPKRYQLQKPFYRPSTQSSYGQSNLGNNKDAYGRPSYGSSSSSQNNHQISSSTTNFNTASSSNYHGSDSFQSQGNYQYLNRPESISSSSFNNNNNYRPEPVSINNFPGSGYGRNNEREGDAPIEAATEVDNKLLLNTSTQAAEEGNNTTVSEETNTTKAEETELKREKRSLNENTIDADDDVPEFPWDRVIEFEKTLVWD
ncbi:doublesex cognate 73A [Cochliomyia hominivorax]